MKVFSLQAAPAFGIVPKETRENSHVYRLGRVPRPLWPVGERLEPRFGKLGREYKNIVFDKEHLNRDATLEWVTPGHPLFEAVREAVTEEVRDDLQRGAVSTRQAGLARLPSGTKSCAVNLDRNWDLLM